MQQNLLFFRSTLLFCMKKQWEAFLPLLTNDDLHLVLKAVKVINTLEIPTNISSATALRLCSTLLNFFFRSLEVEGLNLLIAHFAY